MKFQRKGSRSVLFVFIICLLFFGHSIAAKTTNLSKEQFQKTLSDSMKALWTGEAFTPELAQRQAVMKNMLESGAISKAELKDMMTKEMLPILDHYKTSRYILQDIDERINNLFSPCLDWQTVKEDVVWEAISELFNAENDSSYVLKLATLAPKGTPWLDVPETILVPKIKRLTEGVLKPKFYTGGVMGEDRDVLRKMDIGQLDGCGCTTLGVIKASPDTSVFMVPDLFNNYDEIDYIYKKFRKRLDKSFAERGYICGAIIDSGFLYVFSKNKITGLDDLRKQKALTCLGEVESTLLDELGVEAVPVAMPEVVSALSTGMADTFIAPAAWALGMQAYQYVNYYIKTPFFYSPGVVILSANTRDKIRRHFGVSKALVYNAQELIVLEIKQVEPEWKKRARIYEKKCLKAFEEKCGIKPVVLSPEDQQTFEQAAKSVQEKLAGKAYPRELLNDVLQALEQYRKKRQR